MSTVSRVGSLASKISSMGLCLVLVGTMVLIPAKAAAEPMREFIMSCTYGVLAGTLVGGASLAFSDKPGDNLNKVARGASIGLYAGILLGAYIAYGVPIDNPDDVATMRFTEPPRLIVQPLISNERGLEGGAATLTAYRF
jgi:hypothetical protein